LEFDPAPNLAIFKIPGGSWFHGEGWGTATGSNCLFWNLETDPNFFRNRRGNILMTLVNWARFWTVCNPLTEHYQNLNISLGEHQLLDPTNDLCISSIFH
jgi:hypothetical protein